MQEHASAIQNTLDEERQLHSKRDAELIVRLTKLQLELDAVTEESASLRGQLSTLSQEKVACEEKHAAIVVELEKSRVAQQQLQQRCDEEWFVCCFVLL